MKTVTTCYCEICGKSFTGENSELACLEHENECETYSKGDRIEVYWWGKWWSGTVDHVSLELPEERFIVVHTDEQFDTDVDDLMHTGYYMGIGENTGDKNHVRRLVQKVSAD